MKIVSSIYTGNETQVFTNSFSNGKENILSNEMKVMLSKLSLKYSGLIEKLKNTCSFDDFMDYFNVFLKESDHNHDKLFKSFSDDKKLELSDMYEMQKKSNYFYLLSKNVNGLEVIEVSTNPFENVAPEVKVMLELYDIEVAAKYNNDKCIKLNNSISTREDFCDEINRIYACISHPRFSTLKPILDKFTKHKDVKHHIGRRENNKIFYQFVKKEICPIEEQKNPAKTKENIDFLTAVSDVSASILSPATEKLTPAPPYNPFEEELLPEAKQLSELDLLKAIYSAIVDGPYQKSHSLDERLKLTNENINSVAEFCRELNKIKNNTNETFSSTRYTLLVKFSKDEEVKKLIGIMEGTPKDFYVKPTVELCNNGKLLETVLNQYLTEKPDRKKKIDKILKDEMIKSNITIELKNNNQVGIISFPDDHERIASILTALLKNHELNGSLSGEIERYLKKSHLGAYMQLQPLPDNKIHVVFNCDNLASVNGKIDNLAELMNFMQKHLKDINTELADLPQRPAEGASLEQLQKYFYQQILAFETQSSTYDGVKSVKEWVKKYWGKLLGHADSETFFGAKMEDKPIDTIKNLRQAFHSNLRHENYEKSALNSPEYKIIDQGLGRMQKQAQTLHDLIAKNIVPTDITENLTSALRYSMASECVELKQQSKSINFNHFISKAKVVIPIATVASLIVLAVFPPAAPIAAAILFSAALIYLFTKFKPKLETSAASKQLSSAMTELVYQLPFQLVSHDVSWGEAWKDRKGPIMQAIKSWWSGSETPGPNLSESLNSSPE
ncbi:TPA: MFS transporter permease [Yersinia enterocolitica]